MRTYRIAVIGTGMISKSHFEAIKTLPNAVLAAVCDLNPEKARAAGLAQNVPYFLSAAQLLAEVPTIDVCILCTPTSTHVDLVELCARHKKPVLCEKPMELSAKRALRIQKAVRESGIPYMTAQVVRFWTGYVELKRMLDEGAFGEIYMSYFSRCSQLQRWDNFWLFDPEKGGGALYDMMVHDVDFMHYLFGPAKRVYALGSVDQTGCYNNVFASIEYKNGAKGVAETSFTMQTGYPFTMYAKIMGSRATAEFSYRAGFDINQRAGAECTLDIYRAGEAVKSLAPEQYNAYAREIAYFLDCVETGKAIDVVTAEDSVEVMRTINAIHHAVKTGAVVDMDAFSPA